MSDPRVGHVHPLDSRSRELPALHSARVNLTRFRLGMTEDCHDLVLAAAQFGEELGKAFPDAVRGQVIQVGILAPALEHGRHAVPACEGLSTSTQDVGGALNLWSPCSRAKWLQQRNRHL